MFDVFYEGENNPIKNLIPFAKKVDSFDLEEIKKKCRTKYFFFVEDNIKILDDSVFDTRPDTQRIFKWKKLGFNEYGGISLFPKNCEDALIEHVELSATAPTIDVIDTDPDEYFRNTNAAFVWVGNDLSVFGSSTNISLDENNIYEVSQGDTVATLYPRNWKDLDIVKISLDAEEPEVAGYDVFRTSYMNDYSYAAKSKTDMFWLVDDDLEIQDLSFEPDDTSFIYVFKHPGQLEHRYPAGIKNPKDARAGGIKLVPKEFALDKIKFVEGTPASDKVYSINKIDDLSLDSVIANFNGEGWYVDSDYLVEEISGWIPEVYDRDKIHVFHLKGQLARKYPEAMGGVYWVPKGLNRSTSFKISDHTLHYTASKYPVHRTNDPSDITETDHSAWYIDSEYVISGDIDVVPWQSPNEKNMIHVYHVEDQLDRKYQGEMGGAYWVPADWNGEYYIHKESLPVKEISYPVHFVSDPSDFTGYSECWLVDSEYEMDPEIKVIPWRNTPERSMVHVFHVDNQLSHKYPEKMGGVYWIPKDWNGETYIHETPLRATKHYPVVYSDNPAEDIFKIEDHECWVVDSLYRLDSDFDWIPNTFDLDKVHVFHIENQLTRKYPEAMGGVYWKPKKLSNDPEYKIIEKPLQLTAKEYDVTFVSDPASIKSVEESGWYVDEDYLVDGRIKAIPWQNETEKSMAHVYHVKDQLERKYPGEMGGVYWIPSNWNGEVVVHKECIEISKTPYPVKFVEDPRDFTGHNECWLVDKDYEIENAIDIVPWKTSSERNMVHVFHIAGQLSHKYPEEMGGVYWVPAEWNGDYYIHDRPLNINKTYPVIFADNPETHIQSMKTGEVWVADSLYRFSGKIEWQPDFFDRDKIHVFHLKNQLQRKYMGSMGGMFWVPAKVDVNTQTKIYSAPLKLPVEPYPVVRVDDPSQVKEVENDCWVIDGDYMISESIDFIPWQNENEKRMIHVFHIADQLKRKYTDKMGGAYWIPSDWNGEYYIHDNPLSVEAKTYPVSVTESPSEFKDTGWAVDSDYSADPVINVIPWQNSKERNMVHVFHGKDQLKHKYPEKMGGIYWYPEDWNGEYFIHEEPIALTKTYPIVWSDDPASDIDKQYESDTWVVDKSYRIEGNLPWQPDYFDREKTHVFHIKGQLTNKYTESMGGAYWVPASNSKGLEVHKEVLAPAVPSYPVHYVEDPTDFSDAKGPCWLVDEGYVLDKEEFEVVPWQNEKEQGMVHVYQVAGQLEHKYPEAMGGIYWIPEQTTSADIVIHEDYLFGRSLDFPVYNDEETGRAETNSEWFWVVDKDVTVVDDFSFDFVPSVWDRGKTHVWQRINPITGKQYDYSGVKLCPKIPADKGRPKYMRSPGCVQNQYPVHKLTPFDYANGLKKTYQRLLAESDTAMVWIVDAFVDIDDDFVYDYYPTQYDVDVVHIWQHEGSTKKTGVRLVPTNLKIKNDSQIIQNSFPKLKEIPTVASRDPIWPVERMVDFTVSEISNIISKHKSVPYVWTVEPEIDIDEKLITDSFVPHDHQYNLVHVWKNEGNDSFGGLRLWPTWEDVSRLTDEQIATCSIPDQFIMDRVAGPLRQFPVYHLTAEDVRNGLKGAYEKLSEMTSTRMFWVVDPFVEIEEDFKFDYYPSQYDLDVVHIWKHKSNSIQAGVKLVPRNLSYDSDSQINENSFSKLKQMSTIASRDKIWPVEQFTKVGVSELKSIIEKNCTSPFVWTVDPDIELDNNIIDQSIIPHLNNIDSVHVWKRTNSDGLVVGHGGLRLWPTWFDTSKLSDEQVITSSVPEQFILDSVAGPQKEFPVCFLSQEKDIVDQLKEFESNCTMSMYWVVDPYTTLVDDWDFDYIPTKWEEHVVHVFLDVNDEQRGVRLIPNNLFTETDYSVKDLQNNRFKDLKVVYRHASRPTSWPVFEFNDDVSLIKQLKEFAKIDGCFFTVDTDVTVLEDFNYEYTPQLDSLNKLHIWQKISPHTDKAHAYGGLRLWPENIDEVFDGIYSSMEIKLSRTKRNALQYVRSPGSITKLFDIVYISYYEPFAEENYNKLCERFNNVIWIKDIEGIFNAHKEAAKASSTKMFWVVDADADVVEDFKFSHIPDVYDDDVVHVWSSKNPVTGLEYGYGGVKLFPRDAVLKSSTWGLDFTTGLSKRFKAMSQVSCITRFNTDAYSAWRSAFRECVKLALKDDAESVERLEAWLHPVPDAYFRDDAKRGAEEGRAFAIANKDNISELNKINDYNWLKERFNNG